MTAAQASSGHQIKQDEIGVLGAEVLPAVMPGGFLDAFLQWGFSQTDAPVWLQLAAGTAALSTLLPGSTALPDHGGTRYHPVWWQLVGPSAITRKSTVCKLVQTVVRTACRRLAAQDGLDPDGDLGVWDRLGPEPDSPEAILTSLGTRPQQLVLLPELGHFLAKTRPGSRQEDVRTLLNKAADNDDLTRQLVRSLIKIEGPNYRLTQLGGVTPAYLALYTDLTDWSGGFLSRWGIVVGVTEWYADYRGPRDDLLEVAVSRLCEVARRKTQWATGMDATGLARFNAWTRALHARTQDAPQVIQGAYARAEQLALKLMLLLAHDMGLVPTGATWEVPDRAVAGAILLAEAHVKGAQILLTLDTDHYRRLRTHALELLATGPQTEGALARRLVCQPRVLRDLLTGLLIERRIHLLGKNRHEEPVYRHRSAAEVSKEDDPTPVVLGGLGGPAPGV